MLRHSFSLNDKIKKIDKYYFYYYLHFKCLSTKNATEVNLGQIARMNAVTVCTKNNVTTWMAHVPMDVTMVIKAFSVKTVS